MKIPMLDLRRQYAALRAELEPAMLDCMAGGSYILGREEQQFEQAAAEYLGVKHALGVGNGTDALVLALRALGIGPGDEVVTTPFTFFATAEAVAAVGATPVFADVCEDTYNLDPDSVRKKLTVRTKAILPVHIFGHPADMGPIMSLARETGLRVIEDACQAIGAEWDGKKAGSIGDIGCFSFFPTKNLGGFGDGGMITTNDDGLALLCRALREHCGGRNGAAARSLLEGGGAVETKAEDPLYNPYKYYNYMIGYNSRLDTLQAAILLKKLPHLDEWNAARAEHAAFYTQALAGADVIPPRARPGVRHVWHQYALRTPHKAALGAHLAEKGIASGVFYPVPLHLQKAFDHLGYREGDLPAAERLARETLSLPVFPELTEEELAFIAQSVADFRP